MMTAPAESEMLIGILALDVEGVTACKLAVVAIGRTERHQGSRSSRESDAADGDRLRELPYGCEIRTRYTHHFQNDESRHFEHQIGNQVCVAAFDKGVDTLRH